MKHVDATSLILRFSLSAVFFAHGWNHLRGPGGVAGTARWFASMGLQPARLHAWASGLTELGAGALLALGLLSSLACTAVVAVMTVALVTAHRKNGFFIFRAGQGWEYVGFLSAAALALAVLGPGSVSLDDALGLADRLDGWVGAVLAGAVGPAAAGVMLAGCWRPGRVASQA
jgi:putative oxidoreductase